MKPGRDRTRPRRGALAGSLVTAFGFQAVLVVSGVLAARLLGAEDRGNLALLVLFPTVLAQIGGLGLPLAATYELARAPERAGAVGRALVRPALAQAAALVALHAVILALVLPGRPGPVQLAGVLSLGLVPGLLAFEYAQAVLQGLGRFGRFNVQRLLPQGLYSLGVLALFVVDSDRIALVMLAWVVPVTAVAGLAVAGAARALPHRSAPAPPVGPMVGFGLKGLLGSASPSETVRLDQAAVGLLLTSAELGLYVVALALTNLPRFIAQSVGTVAYPRVAAQPDTRSARRAMWRLVGFTMAVCALVVVVLEALAGTLIPLFFGSAFEDAVPITRILLVAALFLSARRILTDAARGAGLVTAGTLAEAASWLALVPAIALLAPAFGAEGVAAAVVLSAAVSFGALVLAVRARRGPADRGRAPEPLDGPLDPSGGAVP